ncbi:MAG: hypothetical protein XE13_0217 [Proteiniphilum sp. 51_7]|nr:MAG: hypothetical protein XE13_0217 [Proteiniphilum sp. 51_7]
MIEKKIAEKQEYIIFKFYICKLNFNCFSGSRSLIELEIDAVYAIIL